MPPFTAGSIVPLKSPKMRRGEKNSKRDREREIETERDERESAKKEVHQLT
jgi:hypothetical protein